MIVNRETPLRRARIRRRLGRVARGDHLLLLWRRVVASLIASRLLWLRSSRMLQLVTRTLLRVTRATLQRLCCLVNLSSVPALIGHGLTQEETRDLVRLLARKQHGRQQQQTTARMMRKRTTPMTMITTFTILRVI